jgi:predicted RNA-binding protein with PUA-like domain
MNCWLIKSEPDEFSIWDLQAKSREPWTGVRNFQARNYMRDLMQPGDQVIFYHSSTVPPGAVGLAKVVSQAYPDPTQFDPGSDYFDPRATPQKPVWHLVDFGFDRLLPRLVTLEELRANPATATMRVCTRGNRLSITPVTPEEFQAVLELADQSKTK